MATITAVLKRIDFYTAVTQLDNGRKLEITMRREAEYGNNWVLRVNGKYKDSHAFRHTLAESNNLAISLEEGV